MADNGDRKRRVRVLIRGRVQGVGYRFHAEHEARRLGLAGWVRNRSSGEVELVAEGPEAAIEALLRWCRRGPPAAAVASVDVQADGEAPANEAGFRVREAE